MLKSDLRYFFSCLPIKLKQNIIKNNYKINNIKYIIEKEDWAIKNIGLQIQKYIKNNTKFSYDLTHRPYLYDNKIIHFGSQYMWTNYYKYLTRNNIYVSSFFHGKYQDGNDVESHIKKFIDSQNLLTKIITPSNIVTKRIIEYGISPDKIVKIGLGVDTDNFLPNLDTSFLKLRNKINNKALVIGSFQKDGVGWGNGEKPKLIKGPDLLIDTLKKLKMMGVPIFVILLGPARGYVKDGLKKNNIDYFHAYIKDFKFLPYYYNLLNLYLITSREEGGPLGLLESLSCDIPVVSTPVGMAPEVINGENGLLAEIDSDNLSESIFKIYKKQKNNINLQCRKSVLEYDWKKLSNKYLNKIYTPLINKNA